MVIDPTPGNVNDTPLLNGLYRYMVAVSRCENNFARFCTQVWNEFFDNSTTSIEVTRDEFDACTMYTLKVSHSQLASFD